MDQSKPTGPGQTVPQGTQQPVWEPSAASVSDQPPDLLQQHLEQEGGELKKEARRTAHELKDEAKEKAMDSARQGKETLSQHLRHISDALHSAADQLRQNDESWLAGYGGKAADGLERFCDSMDSKEPKEVLNDVEDFGRRSPSVFMESAFVGGLLLGRFLKSSAKDSQESEPQAWEPQPEGDIA